MSGAIKKVISTSASKREVPETTDIEARTKGIFAKCISNSSPTKTDTEFGDIDKLIDNFAEFATKKSLESSSRSKITHLDDLSIPSTSTTGSMDAPSEVMLVDGVCGKRVFGFQTPKRKTNLSQKVAEVVETPTHPRNIYVISSMTPVSQPAKMPPKTPYEVRETILTELEALADSPTEDFSGTDSDYKPSDSESDTEDDEEEENTSPKEGSSPEGPSPEEEELESKDSGGISPSIFKKEKHKIQYKSEQALDDQSYILKPDNYFSNMVGTSNNTLQKLPKLSEIRLADLLVSCNLDESQEHKMCMQKLFISNCTDFNKWMMMMFEGFNILLYGLGSKRNMIQAFQREMLNDDPVIVINGFFPSLTLKDILDAIVVDVLEEKNPANVYESVEIIARRFSDLETGHLYILVHNLDGEMLRDNKAQNVLSSLAAIPNVHLLASVDHINTPLIWDHTKLSKYNFIWWDCTTLLSYSEETSFETSMLVQKSGALALTSLTNVFQSLTKNSKGIFMLIVEHQLNNSSVKYYQGMPFKELYSQCRENFLVSSDLALRAQMTEFLDHKLVKSKRSVDGTEQLLIPIQNVLLQQFKELLP